MSTLSTSVRSSTKRRRTGRKSSAMNTLVRVVVSMAASIGSRSVEAHRPSAEKARRPRPNRRVGRGFGDSDSAYPGDGSTPVVDQPVADRVTHQLGLIVDAHLLHEPRLVRAHGLDREIELRRDLGHRPPGYKHLKDLVFPVGQRGVGRTVGLRHRAQGELLRNLGADERAAAGDLLDGRDELRGRAVFGEIAGGSRLDGTNGVLMLLVHAQDEDAQAGPLALHLLDEIHPALSRHGKIQKQDVEILFAYELQHFVAVASLARDFEHARGKQELLEPLAHDRVIVGDDHADHPSGPPPAEGSAPRSRYRAPARWSRSLRRPAVRRARADRGARTNSACANPPGRNRCRRRVRGWRASNSPARY